MSSNYSKIFKGIIKNRRIQYLEKFKLLSNNQFGFRFLYVCTKTATCIVPEHRSAGGLTNGWYFPTTSNKLFKSVLEGFWSF